MGYVFNPFTGNLDTYGPVITGTGTVSAAADGTETLPGIAFASDLNTGIYRPGADQLALSTSGTQRISIGSTGHINIDSGGVFYDASTNRLGIGTTTPDYLLTVGNRSGTTTSPTAIRLDNTFTGSPATKDKLKFYMYRDASESYGLTVGDASDFQYWAGGSSSGIHRWFTSGSERFRCDSSGRLLVGTSSAVAAGAKLQTVDGITFPAIQVASADANTLDDYEEGTFTPVFRDGVSGTAATATAYGNYTKIGNCVRFHIALVNVTTSGLSSGNTIHITGLPFAGSSGFNVEQSFSAVFNSGSVAAGYVTMQIPSGAAYGILVTNSTTGQAAMPVSAASSGSFDLWVSGVYFT